MKTAKNMDSVFSNCTDDELLFDILFDEDETIINTLAGADEMSKLVSEGLLEEGDDMVGENPDFDYQEDGDAAYSEKDAEGTTEVKPEIGGEVGDGKEVSGKEDSAEANAHDDKDEAEAIGLNDKQQVKLEDASEGPLEDDDKAEREGEVSDTAIETESVDALLKMLEAEDPIADSECPNDSDVREGEDTGVEDTEGVETEVLGAANAGEAKEDPIADSECPNDSDVRAGADTGVKDTEGVETHVVGAALEGAEEEVPADQQADVGNETDAEAKKDIQESISADILAMLEADEEEEATDEKPDAPEKSQEECCKEDAEFDKLLKDLDDDPLIDIDDTEQRKGKAKNKDVEGVKNHVVGAALEATEGEEGPEEAEAVEQDKPEDKPVEESVEGEESVDDKEAPEEDKSVDESTDYLDSLLDDLNDEDDIAAIDNGMVVPDEVKTNGTDNTDIKEATSPEELVDDEDDSDIEAIDGEGEPKSEKDFDYDYSDDELIDAVINGIDL